MQSLIIFIIFLTMTISSIIYIYSRKKECNVKVYAFSIVLAILTIASLFLSIYLNDGLKRGKGDIRGSFNLETMEKVSNTIESDEGIEIVLENGDSIKIDKDLNVSLNDKSILANIYGIPEDNYENDYIEEGLLKKRNTILFAYEEKDFDYLEIHIKQDVYENLLGHSIGNDIPIDFEKAKKQLQGE